MGGPGMRRQRLKVVLPPSLVDVTWVPLFVSLNGSVSHRLSANLTILSLPLTLTELLHVFFL